jgi:hypothetical protein
MRTILHRVALDIDPEEEQVRVLNPEGREVLRITNVNLRNWNGTDPIVCIAQVEP